MKLHLYNLVSLGEYQKGISLLGGISVRSRKRNFSVAETFLEQDEKFSRAFLRHTLITIETKLEQGRTTPGTQSRYTSSVVKSPRTR